MDEIVITARDLELEVNEDDIEDLIMEHEGYLTAKELKEILNEENQEALRSVFPSEKEDGERGAMPTSAVKDLLKKYVLDMGITLTSSCQEKSELHFQNEDSSQLLLVIKATDFQPIIAFMDLLIRNINNSLDVVLDNLASGFKSHPIHGWISCVTQILTDVSKVWSKDFDSEAWSIRLQEIYKLNQAVIILMLDVMAGGKALDNCPSFAEMGKALSTLVEQDDEEELLSISPSFQLLLSWCWINIKESCACLGELTHVVLLHSDKQLLPKDVLYNIGQIFVKVLTTCRHRGAIEGCRDGFFLFSHSLLSSHDPYLNNIPRSILAQILGSLSENSLSSSVTRRSAGLPIIVQIIVQAAQKSRNSDLLVSSVDQLYKLANIPLPPDPSQLQDLSQSHALNILKVIFCDALLAPLLMSQLSKMTILVIEGFDSPSWAIRNAATQLISTLITRILGQKNQFKSSMTLAEFGALYPELLNYLVCKLQLTSTKSTSLYIVLTIVSKLSSAQSYQQEEDLCTSLQSSISSFMSNPVHSLRKLSAKAFVTLSPFDKMKDTLDSILLKVQHKPSTKNELHGWLLCIQNFLLSERASSDVVLKVVDFLLINSWLFSYTPCLMISRAVMDIVQMCLSQIKLSVDSGEKLWSVIKILMKTMTIPVDHVQVDGFHCFRTCLKTLLSISTNSCAINDDFGAKSLKILNESLSSPLDDLRVAALDCLEECLASGHLIPDSNIQKTLLAQLFKENTAYHLIKIADIILKLKMNDLLSHDVFDVNIDILLLKRKWAHNASFTQVLFTIEGLIFGLAEDVHMIDCLSELCFWSEHLINISHPSVNESSRLLAAQALCIAGQNILEFCCRHLTLAGVDDAVTRIIRASVLLLEDTESEVREFAAKFICQFESETSYHYTLCYSILTRLIVRLSWCNSLMSELLDILFTPGHLSDSLKVCLDDKLQQLFEPELTSAFSEPHKLQIWASNTLELLTEHESFSRMLKIKMNATLAELTLKKIELHENAIRNVIFNASCNSRLMSTMFGIILLSHLYQTSLKHQPASKSEEGDKLCECVIWLQQIVSLHPLLRKSQLDLRQLMPLSLIE
ncbi:hypothetical protein Btru_032618 [Bulinus truncatus]|nr:hypothetical protein Btru_032618 [Bulinus truncatus]